MYNLSEDKHIFLHVTYSMLEEGYDIDEILGMWVLADEEELSELMESLTLTEEIDLGNQDLEGITRYYFGEKYGIKLNFNWLRRLFGKGQKIKPPKVTPKANPTKSVTTSGGRPITQGSGSSATNKTPKVTKNTTGTLVDKVKKNAPKIVGGAAVLGGAGLGLFSSDEPGTGNSNPSLKDDKDGEDKKGPVYTGPDGKPVQFPPLTPPPPVPADKTDKKYKPFGWWKIQNQQKDLYKNSPGYQVSLKAYKNIRANPTPSIYGNLKDHYEVIADYLIKEGHASDINEADYVMKQLDEEFIQSIIESSCGSHMKKKKKKK